MAWEMVAVPVKSSEKIPEDQLSDDAKTGVDEMAAFYADNPEGQRLIIPFNTTDERDSAARHIRTYCEIRPAGRLTASIWHGFTGTKGEGDQVKQLWSSAPEGTADAKTPALSVKVRPYVKRTRAEETADDTPPADTAPDGSTPPAE